MAAPEADHPTRGMALLLATLIPAAAAAAAVLVVTAAPWSPPGTRGSAAALARAAESGPTALASERARALRPLRDVGGPTRSGPIAGEAVRVLRPLLASEGRTGIEPSPLEPLDGGVRPAPPQRLTITAAGVDAVVEPVTTRRGALEVPAVDRAGWYEAGARPGEPGRAVLIGHIDGRRGPGVFARVPSLGPGTGLTVTDRRGEVRRFRTIGVVQMSKADFPTEYVYGAAERPLLVLVTCGGPYREGRGYRDNVLLFARAA